MQAKMHSRRKVKFFAIIALIIVLLLLTMVFLSGCIQIKKKFKYDSSVIDPEAVTSILFFDFSFTKSSVSRGSFPIDKYSEVNEDGEYIVKSNEPDPIYTLPQEDIPTFLDELFAIRFVITYLIVLGAWDPAYKYGDYFIRVNFTDGSYYYIADRFFERRDANGAVKERKNPSCKKEKEFDNLVAKYLPVEE